MTKLDFKKEKPLYILAPLAGFTDKPFRSVAEEFGADLTVSEMISANSLVYNVKKTSKMMEKIQSSVPYSVQIAVSSPKLAREAVEIINDIPYIDGIDINCGCPSPKVMNNGSGSALLGNTKLLTEIIQTMKKYSNKDYLSVKIRLGLVEKDHINIAKAVEDGGADFLAVHGRTRAQRYRGVSDYSAIAEVKNALKSMPVIANGDITTYKRAQKVLEITGCDGLMIGRGSIGSPWIFYQLKNNVEEVSNEIKKKIILSHYDRMIEFYGEYGPILFRKHAHKYSNGLSGASVFRSKINNISDIKKFRKELETFFS